VKKSIWEDRVKKNANEKNLGLYHRSQRNVCTIKEKDLLTIQI